MTKYCKCGCGKEILIRKHHKYRGIPNYIIGHNKPHLGKHHSEETKQNIRRSKLGKTHSTEHILNLKENAKNNPNYGMKGKQHKEETKQKLKGRIPPNKGKIREDIRQFIRENTNKHLCKCGCREKIVINRYHHYEGIPDYIHGHNKAHLNHKHTEKTKQIIREKKLGKTSIRKGISLSDSHKEKIRISHLGKHLSEEHKHKIKESVKQTKNSAEWKATVGETTRQKIREKHIGKTLSEEHKNNLSKSRIGKYTGEKSPVWQGGKSFEPYTPDFNKRFKEAIRARDGYCCKLCMIFEEDHIKMHHKKLAIHHINYDKTLTIKENCITLCIRCNGLVNKDRELWTKHFQEMLKRDYGYQFTEEQKVIVEFINEKE